MLGYSWYHGTIRRYIVLFGTIFNDIHITREDANGNLISAIKVPISYGPRDKHLARVIADPELNRPWSLILPMMTFTLKSFYYDADRKLNKVGRLPGKRPTATSKNIVNNVYTPVPYTFNFELQVTVKNTDDGSKIIEQILPWFTPDWTPTVRIIDEPEIILDVPLILNPVRMEDTWEGSFESQRYITYTLSFRMLGNIYGPNRRSPIIKRAITNVGLENTDPDFTMITTPGLTVEGLPTSKESESVPYSDIDWNDTFGYIESLE